MQKGVRSQGRTNRRSSSPNSPQSSSASAAITIAFLPTLLVFGGCCEQRLAKRDGSARIKRKLVFGSDLLLWRQTSSERSKQIQLVSSSCWRGSTANRAHFVGVFVGVHVANNHSRAGRGSLGSSSWESCDCSSGRFHRHRHANCIALSLNPPTDSPAGQSAGWSPLILRPPQVTCDKCGAQKIAGLNFQSLSGRDIAAFLRQSLRTQSRAESQYGLQRRTVASQKPFVHGPVMYISSRF